MFVCFILIFVFKKTFMESEVTIHKHPLYLLILQMKGFIIPCGSKVKRSAPDIPHGSLLT